MAELGRRLRAQPEGSGGCRRQHPDQFERDDLAGLGEPERVLWAGDAAEAGQFIHGYQWTWLPAQLLQSESIDRLLFINAEPGRVIGVSARAFCRTWPNQIETKIAGRHFVQEDSPDEIGAAVAAFVRRLRTP